MRHGEQVVFGGAGLDRAAEVRSDPAAVERRLRAFKEALDAAGLAPPWLDRLLMGGTDVFLAFPRIFLVLLLVAINRWR